MIKICLYLLLSLYNTGGLTLGSPLGKFDSAFLRGWRYQIFKSKAPFICEGIGALSLGDLFFILLP